MSRIDHQAVELAVEPHEGNVVVGFGGAIHAVGDVLQLLSLLLGGPFGASPAEQTLQLAPHLEHEQLIARVDIGDENALARQDSDQTLAGKPLQRFANGRAADLERRRKHLLRQKLARLQAQRDDLLPQAPVGRSVKVSALTVARCTELRERFAAACLARAPRQICFRFATNAANFSYSASFTV